MPTLPRFPEARRLPVQSAWKRNRDRSPAPGSGGPPPPPRPWPALTIGVILDWSGPMPPDPPMSIFDAFNALWEPDTGWYYGGTAADPYEVFVWFCLDLFTGACFPLVQLVKGGAVLIVVSGAVRIVQPGAKIDQTWDTWIGLWPTHTLEVTFRT